MTSRRISLRKRPVEDAPVPVPPRAVATTGPNGRVDLGKGRPTPKRSEAQKRRGGPVLPPPTTRREAAKRLREQQSQDRKSVRTGTIAGDQTKMLARDAGPARALVRDIVDGRRNVGVLMLPIALLYVIVQYAGGPTLFGVVARVFTLGLLLVIADLVVTGLLIRRSVRAEFPGERRMRGHLFYGLLRSTVLRRLRMPPTRVRPAGFLRR